MHPGLRDTPAASQIGSPEHELFRLLGLAGLPEPAAVKPVAGTMLGGREVAWREFLRRRSGGQAEWAGYGFGSSFLRRWQGRWRWGEKAISGWAGSLW
jgi:hypothetical protein